MPALQTLNGGRKDPGPPQPGPHVRLRARGGSGCCTGGGTLEGPEAIPPRGHLSPPATLLGSAATLARPASPAVTVPWGLVQQAQGGQRKACSREHSRHGADTSHKEWSEPGDEGEAKETGGRRLVNQPYSIILGGEGREDCRGGRDGRMRWRGGRDGRGGGLEGNRERLCEGPQGPPASPRPSVGLCTDPGPSRLTPRRAVCELGASSKHKQASAYFGNGGGRPRGQGKRTPCRGGSDRSL